MAIERYYDGTKWVNIKDGIWTKIGTIDAKSVIMHTFTLPANSQEVIIVMDTNASGKVTNKDRMLQMPLALMSDSLTLPNFVSSTITYGSNAISVVWDAADSYCTGKYISVWVK
jgi:hypothetical protein